MIQAPEAVFYEFVYFNRDEFPTATGRTIWTCGGYYFLVSSIVDGKMSAEETMVFQCNQFGNKTSGEDLAFLPDPFPDVAQIKELVEQAYEVLHEQRLRESVEHFVRYEATPDQLTSINRMFMTPEVFD